MSLLHTASFKEFGSLVCLWHHVKLRKTQLEVRSLNVTWRHDLWCHRVIVFLEMCQIVGGTAMANLAALRAAVFFSLSAKNLRGEVDIRPPPRPCAGYCCIWMRSRSRSRRSRHILVGAGAGAVKNGAAPAPKRDTVVVKKNSEITRNRPTVCLKFSSITLEQVQ